MCRLALVSLYATATLLGFAVGVFDWAKEINSGVGLRRNPNDLIAQAILATWWGLTLTGYVLLLWPLSYANHSFILRTWRWVEKRDAQAA